MCLEFKHTEILDKIVSSLQEPGIILHHTGNNNNFTTNNNYHKSLWPNFQSFYGFWMGYHYYIDKECRVFSCRREDELGAHTLGYNKRIGIAVEGNSDKGGVSAKQIQTLEKLVEWRLKELKLSWKDVGGHRDFSPTICPGNDIYNWLTIKKNN